MAILSTGNTFATNDQVTAAKLNTAVNSSALVSGAVDDTTTQLSGGAIIVKDGGISLTKLGTTAYTTGTWTPSLGGTATYTTQEGIYTKVGRLVSARMTLTVNSIGTGSTYAISGLPFTAGDTCAATVGDFATAASSFYFVTALVSGTSINMRGLTSASASASSTPTFFGDGTSVTISALYYV